MILRALRAVLRWVGFALCDHEWKPWSDPVCRDSGLWAFHGSDWVQYRRCTLCGVVIQRTVGPSPQEYEDTESIVP